MSSGRRIGVFGSLFNPPHLGHLLLCSEAAWQLDLERVVLVPTARPAHRPAPVESEAVRYSMAVAFAATDPILSVSRVELDRPGPSYMVDTLRELARRYPLCEIVLLLGGDQLATLGTWHEAESLPRLARIAVAPRPGVEIPGLAKARVDIIEMPLLRPLVDHDPSPCCRRASDSPSRPGRSPRSDRTRAPLPRRHGRGTPSETHRASLA